MAGKRGFFDIFRGGNKAVKEEEQKQREHAKSMAGRDDSNEESREEVVEEPVEEISAESQEILDFCVSKMAKIFELSGFPCNVKFNKRDGDKIFLEIVGEDDLGRVIGKDGGTLRAFQTLLRAFAAKEFSKNVLVFLDAGNYRSRRVHQLRGSALKEAKKVLDQNKKVELKPMNAADRRVVHVLFQNDKSIQTVSIGSGSDRRIILEKRKNGELQPK